jgi:GLPGLI family protein
MFVIFVFLLLIVYIIHKFVHQNKIMKKLFIGISLVLTISSIHNTQAQSTTAPKKASTTNKKSPTATKSTGTESKVLTEGVIIYDLKVEGAEELGMMAAMMPTEMTVKFKGTKSRAEFATGMSETIALNDSKDDNNATVLLDLMGNKYAMKIDAAKIQEQKANRPEYEAVETKETKVIAGYTCKKMILINKKNKDEVVVYFTPDIPFLENSFNSEFKMLNGMPMEFSSSMNNIKMTVTVREVKKEKIDDAAFTIPAEYKLTTQEELMKELGAGGE